MDISQITETLQTFFDENRVVFWNDAESEFGESLPDIVPADVKILRVDETGALAAKIRIELEEPKQKFLVYAPTAKPEAQDDWLYDIRCYARQFTADSASLLLNELGLQAQNLRDFLKMRKQFFASRDRLQKLKRWILPEDGRKELDKKMLAVVARADQPETFTILLKIFGDLIIEVEKNGQDLRDFAPDVWKDIEKFNLADYFWDSAAENFGYQAEKPRLYDLLVHLFVTDFAGYARESLPNALKPLALENHSGAFNASVFLANWRANTTHSQNYRKISRNLEREIKTADWIGTVKSENLAECETFELVERRVIADLRDRLLAQLPSETSDWENLINARRDRFWCRGEGNSYLAAYAALAAALEFYRLREQYAGGFNFPNAAAVFTAYREELFKFDQHYRRFCEASREIKFEGWNVLKPLTEGIENAYGNWFLETLATAWGKAVEHENLFENWRVGGAANQYNFFQKFVRPLANESAERKIYVIVSDAFRYECAEELMRDLNTEARKNKNALLEAELSAMLGVVPSYTALGMASLLPHDALDYKTTNPNADILYADENSTAGLASRANVLSRFKGTAIKSDDFINLGKDAGREFVRDFQIIYVYHNVIDAIGDAQSTESETFNAARQAITELRSIVNYIFNSLNGSQIFITADHGFLFQENAPVAIDRSALDVKSAAVLKRKKRYVINPQIVAQENAWHGKIKNTAHIAGEMEFLIPKGANRFHFAGGARFVHGGAMPQEICVPVMTIKKLRGRAAERTQISRVGVALLGNLSRIVNNVQRFEFIQTEAVSERNLPRTLQISLRDAKGELISNEATVTFDSRSDSMEDRRRSIQLTLRAGSYDRTEQYFLVLNDADAIVKEYLRLPVVIDIAFSSDF
ncbi:MAG: BREX-1 system phosphatase PglZ type A [Acidobacteriota bacterium]|nr:BREX-1 system phosphatase PglZ type A [Acidobacteriota bacterium]